MKTKKAKIEALLIAEAKVEALRIASTVINELTTSDCTDSQEIKMELAEISMGLLLQADSLEEKLTKTTKP